MSLHTFPLVSLIRNFPQLRFFLPKYSSLCQIDRKISQHKVSVECFTTDDISKPSDPRFRAITGNGECFKEYKPDQNSVLLDMGGLLHYKNHSSCCCQHKDQSSYSSTIEEFHNRWRAIAFWWLIQERDQFFFFFNDVAHGWSAMLLHISLDSLIYRQH